MEGRRQVQGERGVELHAQAAQVEVERQVELDAVLEAEEDGRSRVVGVDVRFDVAVVGAVRHRGRAVGLLICRVERQARAARADGGVNVIFDLGLQVVLPAGPGAAFEHGLQAGDELGAERRNEVGQGLELGQVAADQGQLGQDLVDEDVLEPGQEGIQTGGEGVEVERVVQELAEQVRGDLRRGHVGGAQVPRPGQVAEAVALVHDRQIGVELSVGPGDVDGAGVAEVGEVDGAVGLVGVHRQGEGGRPGAGVVLEGDRPRAELHADAEDAGRHLEIRLIDLGTQGNLGAAVEEEGRRPAGGLDAEIQIERAPETHGDAGAAGGDEAEAAHRELEARARRRERVILLEVGQQFILGDEEFDRAGQAERLHQPVHQGLERGDQGALPVLAEQLVEQRLEGGLDRGRRTLQQAAEGARRRHQVADGALGRAGLHVRQRRRQGVADRQELRPEVVGQGEPHQGRVELADEVLQVAVGHRRREPGQPGRELVLEPQEVGNGGVGERQLAGKRPEVDARRGGELQERGGQVVEREILQVVEEITKAAVRRHLDRGQVVGRGQRDVDGRRIHERQGQARHQGHGDRQVDREVIDGQRLDREHRPGGGDEVAEVNPAARRRQGHAGVELDVDGAVVELDAHRPDGGRAADALGVVVGVAVGDEAGSHLHLAVGGDEGVLRPGRGRGQRRQVELLESRVIAARIGRHRRHLEDRGALARQRQRRHGLAVDHDCRLAGRHLVAEARRGQGRVHVRHQVVHGGIGGLAVHGDGDRRTRADRQLEMGVAAKLPVGRQRVRPGQGRVQRAQLDARRDGHARGRLELDLARGQQVQGPDVRHVLNGEDLGIICVHQIQREGQRVRDRVVLGVQRGDQGRQILEGLELEQRRARLVHRQADDRRGGVGRVGDLPVLRVVADEDLKLAHLGVGDGELDLVAERAGQPGADLGAEARRGQGVVDVRHQVVEAAVELRGSRGDGHLLPRRIGADLQVEAGVLGESAVSGTRLKGDDAGVVQGPCELGGHVDEAHDLVDLLTDEGDGVGRVERARGALEGAAQLGQHAAQVGRGQVREVQHLAHVGAGRDAGGGAAEQVAGADGDRRRTPEGVAAQPGLEGQGGVQGSRAGRRDGQQGR